MPTEEQKTEAKIPSVQALSVASGSASGRVKYWEGRFHAALRPDALRAIAEGIAHPNSTFTISSVQECLRIAADKIEALEQSLPNAEVCQPHREQSQPKE